LRKGGPGQDRQLFASIQAKAPQLFDIAKIVAESQNGLQLLPDAIVAIAAIAERVSSALIENFQKERFRKPPTSKRIVAILPWISKRSRTKKGCAPG
jgi:hypothetical protein